MSYDIYIGHVERKELTNYDGEWSCDATIQGIELPDAPAFPYDVMSQHANERHPGYGAWGEFCDETKLSEMFFDKNVGLMRRHPGTFALTPEHLAQVTIARKRWQAHHHAEPGFDYYNFGREPDDGVRGRDGILARLLWLEWWIGWALENCERPGIHNH